MVNTRRETYSRLELENFLLEKDLEDLKQKLKKAKENKDIKFIVRLKSTNSFSALLMLSLYFLSVSYFKIILIIN